MLALHALGLPLKWTPVIFDERSPLLPPETSSDLGLDQWRDEPVDPDVVVLHSVPEIYPALSPFRDRATPWILHTVWEHEVLQSHWPGLLNQFDGVIVPTEWNADVFRSSGVTVPVAVVPHVAATDPAATEWLARPPVSAGESFVVGSIAEWTLRKEPWVSVEAYARAFTPDDDTLLVMRTNSHIHELLEGPAGPPGKNRLSSWWVAHGLFAHHPVGRVHLVHEALSFEQIAGLHARSDCYLALPRCEGWDLGTFDAAVSGTPVITTASAGPLEYLEADSTFLIAGSVVPHDPIPGATWLLPHVDEAVDALRAAHARPDAATARAAAQAERLRERFSPPNVATRFVQALVDLEVMP